MKNDIKKSIKVFEELSKVGFWEWDLVNDTILASDKTYEIYGTSKEIDGAYPNLNVKYGEKDAIKKIEDAINNLSNNGDYFSENIHIIKRDTKEKRIVNIKGKIEIDENGVRTKIKGIVRDITKYIEQEVKLEIASRNFKVSFENSPVPMILQAEDGEFLLMNKACLDLTGYEFEELNSLTKWMGKIHRERKDFNLEFVKKAFYEGVKITGLKEDIYTKNGEKRIWAFHNSNLGKLEDGREAIITVCVDMTEEMNYRNEQEKLLQELENTQILLKASIESTKEMIILSIDTNYNYLFYNDYYRQSMKHVYDVDLYENMNLLDSIPVEEDRIKAKKRYDIALSGKSTKAVETYGKDKKIYFETFYNPIYNTKNEIIGASVFSSNVTERVNELQKIKESEEKFRLIYSSMSQGLAVHDIITNEKGEPIDYRFVEINDSYSKLFGHKKEDVVGKRVKDVAPLLEQYWIDVFGKVALTGESMYFENYSLTVDKYLSTYAYSTKPGQFAVLISDITERTKKEEEIKFLSYNDQLTGVHNRRYYEEQLISIDTEENLPLSLIMGDVNGLKLVNDSFGHLVGDELLKKVAIILKKACRTTDIITRIGGDEFVIILPNTSYESSEMIIKRIHELCSYEKAKSIDISISFGHGTKVDIDESLEDVFKQIEDKMYRSKLNEGASMRSSTIDLIMTTLYEKNEREMNHSKRVSRLSERLAIELGFGKEAVNQAKNAGLMHDIGKIGIDEVILNKTKGLSNSEWKEVKKHSEIGYRILSSLNEFSEIANHILEHHEKWDGSGYPKGLKGEEISLQARIINIADSYDAMTGPRPYKKPISKETAIKELRKYSGIQFDPNIVELFITKVLRDVE